ncbi:MAG: Fe-S cluster assembly protein SufD [Bacteroidota bacterium]
MNMDTHQLQSEKVASFISNLQTTSIQFPKERIELAEKVLSQIEFPTSRSEAWKYTRVAKIANLTLVNGNGTTSNLQYTHSAQGSIEITIENGVVTTITGDLPVGLTIKSMHDCSAFELKELGQLVPLENEIFSSINTLYLQDGLFIHVAANCIVEKSIEVTHHILGANQLANFRNFIIVEKNSKASLVYNYIETEGTASFVNVVNEVMVGENSSVYIDKLQNETDGNFHIETDQILQNKNSNFTINTITLGGSFVRNNLSIAVAGTNCETHLNGAYVLEDQQHVDNHTTVDHQMAHCVSNELYKGIIGDKATAVFNGKVFVRKDAQKVNAYQSNANILLSDNATVNSKPELEIYADDVKCSHGSTTGQMDEQAIFYLRARGLSEKSAKQLLVGAFIGDALEKISSEKLKTEINTILLKKFGWE